MAATRPPQKSSSPRLLRTPPHRAGLHAPRAPRPHPPATALINEACLRLIGDDIDWNSRAHFIGLAARVMRQVLVDYAAPMPLAVARIQLKRRSSWKVGFAASSKSKFPLTPFYVHFKKRMVTSGLPTNHPEPCQ
jgi:hypothetical protein